MTEAEARAFVTTRWGADKADRLERFGKLVAAENSRQNLVSPASLTHMWSRHLFDSAQLLNIADDRGHWVDIGTGAGFPGMVVALLGKYRVTLIEPRGRRVTFLREAAGVLGCDVRVVHGKAEAQSLDMAEIVSARAVASIAALFSMAVSFTAPTTTFLLPRGRTWEQDLRDARQSWRGLFHVEQSLTSDEARIVVAKKVRPCSASR